MSALPEGCAFSTWLHYSCGIQKDKSRAAEEMRPGDWGVREPGLLSLERRACFSGGARFSILGSPIRKADSNPIETKTKMLLTSEPCLMMDQ